MIYGPNIVTDGLVLYLDAANPKSYPGTGTTWYDLSGNNNHFTLYNGASFSNNIMAFDGVNDYMRTINNLNLTSTNVVTVLYFIQPRSYGTVPKMIHELSTNFNPRPDSFCMSFSDPSAGQNYEVMAFLRGNVGYNVASYSKTILNDLLWHHHTVIHDTTQISTEHLMYSDGQPSEPVIQNPVTGYSSNNTNTFGNLPFYIASRAGISYFAPINLGSVQMYNRALTLNEIQQNYNAQKSRFNL